MSSIGEVIGANLFLRLLVMIELVQLVNYENDFMAKQFPDSDRMSVRQSAGITG